MPSSLNLLQRLLALCEQEVSSIGLRFNVSKCCALRIGDRHRFVIPELLNLFGSPFQWVAECKY